MDNLRSLRPTDNANAARYRPVQPVKGRVVRECCQNTGSRSLAFLHWNRNYLMKVSKKTILKF